MDAHLCINTLPSSLAHLLDTSTKLVSFLDGALLNPREPCTHQGSLYLWWYWRGCGNSVRPASSVLLISLLIMYLLNHLWYSVYGITILQAYIYFRNRGKDSVYMQFLVSEP